MSHTPGPWKFDSSTGVVKSGRETVCELFGPTDDETQANGRLITAAPDLMQADEQAATRIEQVLKDDRLNPNHRVVLDLALTGLRAAIAKARGQ